MPFDKTAPQGPPPPPIPAVSSAMPPATAADAPAAAPTIASADLAKEIAAALLDVLSAAQSTPGPLAQRLLSRKFLATVVYEIAVLASAVAGGLPHHDAAIVSAVGAVVYVLAEAIVDAADRLTKKG